MLASLDREKRKSQPQPIMKTSATRKKNRIPKPGAGGSGHCVKAAELLNRAPGAPASSQRVPPKRRWHYNVLLSLRNRLLKDRGELRRTAAEPVEPHSLDEADSATDEFDHNLAPAQLTAGQNALYDVGAALRRIQNGTYGVCEATGDVIPSARLRAIPWARFTREAEECLERGGSVPRAHLNQATTVRRKGRIWLAPEEEVVEAGERRPAPDRDEALLKVFLPTGRHAPRSAESLRTPKAPKRKGRANRAAAGAAKLAGGNHEKFHRTWIC
jgi:RNA polymerase-binding transcription factor DksA